MAAEGTPAVAQGRGRRAAPRGRDRARRHRSAPRRCSASTASCCPRARARCRSRCPAARPRSRGIVARARRRRPAGRVARRGAADARRRVRRQDRPLARGRGRSGVHRVIAVVAALARPLDPPDLPPPAVHRADPADADAVPGRQHRRRRLGADAARLPRRRRLPRLRAGRGDDAVGDARRASPAASRWRSTSRWASPTACSPRRSRAPAIVLGRLGATAAMGLLLAVWFLALGFVFGATVQAGVPGVAADPRARAAGGAGVRVGRHGARAVGGRASVVQGVFPLVFVVVFLSSAFFPRELLSEPAQSIADYNPMSFIAEGVRDPIIGGITRGRDAQGPARHRDRRGDRGGALGARPAPPAEGGMTHSLAVTGALMRRSLNEVDPRARRGGARHHRADAVLARADRGVRQAHRRSAASAPTTTCRSSRR